MSNSNKPVLLYFLESVIQLVMQSVSQSRSLGTQSSRR